MQETETTIHEHLPKQESARIAVERAREIVRNNNEWVQQLKQDSCIPENRDECDPFHLSETISFEKTYTFNSNKIKSSLGFSDFVKDLFGVH